MNVMIWNWSVYGLNKRRVCPLGTGSTDQIETEKGV
jgi:hypothetical protein